MRDLILSQGAGEGCSEEGYSKVKVGCNIGIFQVTLLKDVIYYGNIHKNIFKRSIT